MLVLIHRFVHMVVLVRRLLVHMVMTIRVVRVVMPKQSLFAERKRLDVGPVHGFAAVVGSQVTGDTMF